MNFKIIVNTVLLFVAPFVFSNTIYTNSVEFAEVQKALFNSLPGDTICLPKGVGDWQADLRLKVPGGITIIGKGHDQTIIKRTKSSKHHLIVFDGSNGKPNELHNIGFEGTYTPGDTAKDFTRAVRLLNGCVDFKISGCKFTGFAACAICLKDKKGNVATQRGVIYKNQFIDNYYDQIRNYGYAIVVSGNNARTKLELGTKNAVFVEDNFFSGNRHHIASNDNSVYVFRYNKVKHTNPVRNYAMTDAHGKSITPYGSRSFEIYNNEYYTEDGMDSRARNAIGIRGGDGVIFNNKCTDKIYRTVELYAEGFPKDSYSGECQTREIYIWNNETHDELGITKKGIKNNSEYALKEGRNYFLKKKPNYKPYPYPHPLRTAVN